MGTVVRPDQVQAGHGELAQHQDHGQQRGGQVGQHHPPQRAGPTPRPATWPP